VTPGAPASPSAIAGDWFARASREASAALSANGLPPEKGYAALTRVKDGATLRGSSVVVQPADAPLDVDAQLASTDMTTTIGATRLWRRTSVRGNDAVMRSCAVQQWESGAVNRMPAVLEWSEPTEAADGPTYVHYALLGDDLGVLRTAADGLAILQ